MAITAASIEANGWVLRVTLTGSLSAVSATDATGANFAGYTQAPNTGMPLTLAMSSNGFVQSGGTAVASAAVGRSLTATKVLRHVVEAGITAASRAAKRPDETDNGNGTITVRIALSQHVYAGDSGLTLTAAAGWRAGEGAASGITVANNSTVLAPAPIVRWADVPYQLQPGSFDLEVVVASHHPNALAPVAGVRFTVTDGTTVKSFWTTALVTSTKYPATSGDGAYALPLRVYRATVDPTTAVALTRGLLRCDFEVYPWLGPVQKSDAAGTKSMTGLGTAAFSTSAFVPFVVAYNPGNTWITPLYVDVDETNGTATPTSVTVSSNPATAAAGTPAISVNVAIQALFNANVTVAAANGQAAITRSMDGAHIRLRKANAATGCTGIATGMGTYSVGTGIQAAATFVTIEGDAADATGRACVLRAAASGNARLNLARTRLNSLSIEAAATTFITSPNIWLSNFELRAIAGQEAATTMPFSANGAMLLTGGKWWKHNTSLVPAGSTFLPLLLRSVQVERATVAPVLLNVAHLPSSAAGTGVGGATVTAPSTDAGLSLERLAIGCDLRWSVNAGPGTNMSGLANASAPGNLTLGTAYPVLSRWAFLNNVCESYGTAGIPMWGSVGENNPVVATEFIVEGNTFTGDRTNYPYDDLNLATVALNDTADNVIRVLRSANNLHMGAASKHDFFNDPAVAAQRIGGPLSGTRNRAYAAGAEIVIAGSPANIYHCTTAGTTAATGGPAGTGSAITDGTVVWAWIATEARQHGYRANATGGWPSHYGVGFEGNVDFRPASVQDPEFLFEFFGLGSDQLGGEGISVTATPFTFDKSGGVNRQPFQPLPDGTGGGNYRPLTTGSGVYALGRARSANVDVDQTGAPRTVPFAAGAIEVGVVGVVPSPARSPSVAKSGAAGWSATLAGAAVAMPSRATSGAARWFGGLIAGNGVVATRASASLAGWSTQIVGQPARSATRATAAGVTWATTIAAAGARSGMSVADGTVAWLVALLPDPARSATSAASAAITAAASWPIAAAGGRLTMVDRTLPILLPGSPAPPDRTLTVTGDFRTLTVDGDITFF